MNTQELFEAAQLDALGLLDEREQAEFEAAFSAASPAIRAQLRDEQARFAKPDRLRLTVEPPVELRARILGAIKAEIAEAAGAAKSRLHSAGRELPTVHPVRRVSRAWRVAALASLSIAVVLSVMMVRQNAEMQKFAMSNNNDAALNKLVDIFGQADLTEAVFSPDVKKISFVAKDAKFKGEAAVFYNSAKQTARVFCNKFVTEPNETVRLVAIDDNGKVIEQIAEFSSSGEIITTRPMPMAGFNPKQLALYVAARGVEASRGRLAMITANI
ncbi:MAG: hypothetical protein JSS51_00040 [Planctomycetes bacterium]|nr:hypothetical protein [Planctomycetota bacterium]